MKTLILGSVILTACFPTRMLTASEVCENQAFEWCEKNGKIQTDSDCETRFQGWCGIDTPREIDVDQQLLCLDEIKTNPTPDMIPCSCGVTWAIVPYICEQ